MPKWSVQASVVVVLGGIFIWFASFLFNPDAPKGFGYVDVVMLGLFLACVGWVLWRDKTRRGLYRFCRRKPLGAAGLIVIVVLVLAAILATLAKPFPENGIYASDTFMGPGLKHFAGTDELGRDIFSRLLVGSRVSLFIGITSVAIASLAGLILGVLSGYYPGKVDNIIQRVMDTFMAFPALILAMVIIAVLGQSLINVIISIAIVSAPRTSRVVRGVVLSLKEEQFVEAARAIGVGEFRMLARHIVPNVMAPMIIMVTVGIGGAILTEGSLSFLGLGPPPPDPTWGRMLSGASTQFMEKAPWMAIFPGVALSLVVLATNFLGDALRDVLDPRLRGR